MAETVKYWSGDVEAIFSTICDRISHGETLREICRENGMPGKSTIYSWIDADEKKSGRFAHARKKGFDEIAEECVAIADDASNDWMETHDKDGQAVGWRLNGDHVQRSKLRIETRLKLLAKWDPKRYGEKVETTLQGPDGGAIPVAMTVSYVDPPSA